MKKNQFLNYSFVSIVLLLLQISTNGQSNKIYLEALSSYKTNIFDDGASEVPAYDSLSQRVFFTNAGGNKLEIISISDPENPVLFASIDLSPYGGGPNSVDIYNGIVAVAVQNDVKTDPGKVVFFNGLGTFLNQVEVGALPDNVRFTPDGQKLLVANEGEPNDEYTVDPEGSISIIDISGGIAGLTQANVTNIGFASLNGATLDPSIRIFGPNATVAQDMEPEYIAISEDSQTAWAICQENNAMIKIDINSATILDVYGLGFKDHSQTGNELDASNDDGVINITNWPVYGMYLPDEAASFRVSGIDYIITANEGDSRDYDGFGEEERVKDVVLDTLVFPDYASLQQNENLGRLKITSTLGDIDNDGEYEELYSFGARSFAIWNGNGNLVYESGAEFENLTASYLPTEFNSTNDENNSFDDRSDDKGPEPEGVAIGKIGGEIYAFISLERIGGIMVFKVSDPLSPEFETYINNRDFSGDPQAGTAGDLAPEGMKHIPASVSPNGKDLLLTANEVSGSLTIYEIKELPQLTGAVVVGGVTENSAKFWVRISEPGTVNVELFEDNEANNSIFGTPVQTTLESNFAGIIDATGLTPNTKYNYRIWVNGQLADTENRTFRTFVESGSQETFSFAFGSCQQSGSLLPSPTPPGNIYNQVVLHEPRFFLHLGDWGYPDTTDNAPINNNFFSADYGLVQQTYADRFATDYPMNQLFKIAPVGYVYDDHDYMNDNASALTSSFFIPFRPNPLGNDFVALELPNPDSARENSIRGYKENMPSYPLANDSRGIYHSFKFGIAEFFMLDLRSQRSSNFNSISKNASTGLWEFNPPAGHSILGRDTAPGQGESQLTWLLNGLQNSTAEWKFIVSSVPFNIGQAGAIQIGLALQDSVVSIPGIPVGSTGIFAAFEFVDKWVGFPEDIQVLLSFIAQNNIDNVIVLSGDSHNAAIDDGTNAGIPEIMAGGLDITNSRIAAIFSAFGLNIWNKGGQGLTTPDFNNAFGKVTVFGEDSVRLELIDEFGTLFASHTVYPGYVVPVELSSFSASVKKNNVTLNWMTATETNNYGFEIERSTDNLTFETIGFVEGSGTTTEPRSYFFLDPDLKMNDYYYRLKQIDIDGSFEYSLTIKTSIGIPDEYELAQNYPNPFNPATTISYSLPLQSRVTLKVYDILGEEVMTLVNGMQEAGVYDIEFNAGNLASGIYFYRLQANEFIQIKKMNLIK